MKIVATNKKAFHDYFVIDSFEAGINLVGCEVKSVRAGEVNLKDSYAMPLYAAGSLCLFPHI